MLHKQIIKGRMTIKEAVEITITKYWEAFKWLELYDKGEVEFDNMSLDEFLERDWGEE